MSWLWGHPFVLVFFTLGAFSFLVTAAVVVLALVVAARDRRERVLRSLRAEHYARCDAFAFARGLPSPRAARRRRGFGA